MGFRTWTDIDRWTDIDLDYIVEQSSTISNDLNKDAIKDAISTIKNSLTFLEKKKATKEDRDRITKERINILLRLGFQVRLKDPAMAQAGATTEEVEAKG